MNRFFFQNTIRFNLFFLFVCTSWLSSCKNHDECGPQVDISGINPGLKTERLELQLQDINTPEALKSFMDANPVVADHFFMRRQYPDDSLFISAILKTLSNAHIDTLLMEVQQVFGDFSDIEADFNKAFAHLKYYYPDVTIPKVKTVISGLNNDLFISDSLIIIGLDYYLGEGASFRPKNYEYILKRYAKPYIVPSCMLLYGISSRFNRTDVKDNTILAESIAYGKSFHFAKSMMPCTPDSVLIWYSKEEMEGVRENENIIWAHFIENELLYETNHFTRRKYIEERPKTYEIGEKCPGRIGTWVGWQIVNAYVDAQPGKSLNDVMMLENPKLILEASRYKPAKPGFF